MRYKEVVLDRILSETEKSCLLKLKNMEDPVWVPRSLLNGGANYGDELVEIADWFLQKNNISC